MTNLEQPLYTHTHYIWHRVLFRLIVMGPFAITGEVAKIISDVTYKLVHKIDEMLPSPYEQTKVPFDQLSKGEQKEIKRVAKARGAILSQVYDD